MEKNLESNKKIASGYKESGVTLTGSELIKNGYTKTFTGSGVKYEKRFPNGCIFFIKETTFGNMKWEQCSTLWQIELYVPVEGEPNTFKAHYIKGEYPSIEEMEVGAMKECGVYYSALNWIRERMPKPTWDSDEKLKERGLAFDAPNN